MKGMVTLTIGTLIVLVGLYFLIDGISFVFVSEKTEGVVVSVYHTARVSVPTIEYRVNDKIYSYTPTANSSFSEQEGQKVTIYYDTNDPSKARIRSFSHLWSVGLIPSVFGGLLILSGVYQIRTKRVLDISKGI